MYYNIKQIQMFILALGIIVMGCAIVFGPLLFRYTLLALRVVHSVQFTMIHPFNYGNIVLNQIFKLSFLKGVSVFIHRVQLKVRGWRLLFRIEKMQVFLQLNNMNFQKLNQLKENYEAKCLNNILTILPEIVEYYLVLLQINKNKEKSNGKKKEEVVVDVGVQVEAGPLKKSIAGLFTVAFMLLTQFIQVEVENIEIDFTEDKSSIIDFLKLKALSILNLRFPSITILFNLTKNYELEFNLSIPTLLMEQFSEEGRDMYRIILEIEDIGFLFRLPFNLNIQKAMEHSDIKLKISSLLFRILPSDLEHICDLLAGMSFMGSIKQFCNQKARPSTKTISQQIKDKAPGFATFTVQIPIIQIQIKEIYQKDSDTNQSSEYLTCVKSTALKALNLLVNIEQHGNVRFTVDEIGLQLSMIDSFIKMLSIKSFVFQHQVKGKFNSLKSITHDNVVVETTPESLAVLTKIFIILSRIRRQHYELVNYIQFLNSYLDQQKSLLFFVPDGDFEMYLIGLKKHIKSNLGPMTLLQLYKRSLAKPLQMNSQEEYIPEHIESKVIYSAGQVSFNLVLKQIVHRLDFVGASYERIMERSRVLNVVKVEKLVVALPASGKKEFELIKTEMYIKEGKLLTEVDMFIDEFTAIQNQMCLIEYLVGFPILEKAMQITSSEKKSSGKGRSRQTYNIKRTSFSYQKIFLNLHEFTFQVGKKTLDPSQLNMSVVKIQLLYKFDMKIPKGKFMFINKNSIKKDVVMSRVSNITLNSYQGKHVIVVKSPQIILPKEFIGMGKEYQKLETTISNLGSYMEAYLLNINDQILREIRRNIQQRIQPMAYLEVRCYKLNLQIQDSEWNVFVLNYNRVIRQYLSAQLFYNEQEVINEINRGKTKKPLLDLNINELRMQTGPIKGLDGEESIIEYMKNIGDMDYEASQVHFFNYGVVDVEMNKVVLNLRDYPFDIINLESLNFQSSQVLVHMKPSYFLDNCVFYYFIGKVQVGQLKVTGGLNISSAIKQLSLRINKLVEGYTKAPEKTAEQLIWLQAIKKIKADKNNKQKIKVNTNYIPVWQLLRKRIFFSLSIQKSKETVISLLTDVRPYDLEAIVIKLGKLYVIGDKEEMLITFHGLGIYKELLEEEFKMMDFGKINCKILLSWKPLLHIEFQVAMGEEFHNMIHLRTDLIQFLINLPQLRTDTLLLYGIDIPKASTELGDLSGKTVELSLIKWMNYGELVQFAFDNTLDKNKNTLSVWNIIQKVTLTMSLRELSLILSTPALQSNGSSANIEEIEAEGVQLIFGHSRLKLTCIPEATATKSEWVIKGGSGKIDTTVGRIYDGQLLTLNEIEEHYQQKDLMSSRNASYDKDLFETLVIADSRMKSNFKEYPKSYRRFNSKHEPPKKKEQFFLQSNSLIFIKNHMYRGEDGEQFIAKNFIEYDGLRLVLSGTLTNIINRLSMIKYKKQIVVIHREQTKMKRKESSSPARVSLFKDVQQDLVRKQILMEKFRNAVRLIIGRHRKGGIKNVLERVKLNVMFILRHPQINIFYEQKHCQIVLRTPKYCQILFRVNHLKYDSLELDPKYSMQFRFQQFQLWSCTSFTTVKWLEKDMRNYKEMHLCLQCPSTILKMSLFKLEKCGIDFSLRVLNREEEDMDSSIDRTKMWGLEQRKKSIDIDLHSVTISLDGAQKLALINIIQFFILMTTSKKKRFIQQTKIYQSKMNEIKIYGKTKILERLVNKVNKDVLDATARTEVCMKFKLSKIFVRLINQNQKNSLVSKCFMEVKAEEIILDLVEQTNNCTIVSMETKEIEIINPLEEAKSKFRTMLAMNHLGKTVLKFHLETYTEKVFDKNNTWNYHRLLSLSINPIKVKFTDQLYSELTEFIQFGLDDINYVPETLIQKNNLQRFAQPQEIQEYYNKIIIEPIKVQLWYQSTNMLKRMDGISIQLGKFMKSSKFCLKKEIVNSWTKFILKQIIKQAFSVLGQKMFGGEEEDNSDQEEIVV